MESMSAGVKLRRKGLGSNICVAQDNKPSSLAYFIQLEDNACYQVSNWYVSDPCEYANTCIYHATPRIDTYLSCYTRIDTYLSW